MSEKTVRVLTEAEKYSGRTNGIPWDKFDEKVVSWGRLKYGERFSKALWRNELMSLQDLDLTDDLDLYKFEEHCALVNDVISNESPKYADSLLKDKRFKKIQWQVSKIVAERDSAKRCFASLKRSVKGRRQDNCKKGE